MNDGPKPPPAGRLGQIAVGECDCRRDGCGCVVIESSLFFVGLSLVGPVLLVVLGGLWVVAGGPFWAWVFLVVGLILAGVVLVDMPISSAFSERGVLRRTPARDHQLGWADIESVALTRSGRRPGVVALVGRRKYLLAERVSLTRDELDLLVRMRP